MSRTRSAILSQGNASLVEANSPSPAARPTLTRQLSLAPLQSGCCRQRCDLVGGQSSCPTLLHNVFETTASLLLRIYIIRFPRHFCVSFVCLFCTIRTSTLVTFVNLPGQRPRTASAAARNRAAGLAGSLCLAAERERRVRPRAPLQPAGNGRSVVGGR